MALEIERKFLVKGDFKSHAAQAIRITQGYLSTVPGRTVRIRTAGEKGYLTIKGLPNPSGTTRSEWEWEIPAGEAAELLLICEPGIIDKTRYKIREGRHTFEVDEFHGDNAGLVVAEIELESEDEDFSMPAWLGEEVTGNRRYYNSALTKKPFSEW